MTDTIWKKLWLLTLIANDVEQIEAQQAFDVLYGNQKIDLNKDPIADALILLPKSIGHICVSATEQQNRKPLQISLKRQSMQI